MKPYVPTHGVLLSHLVPCWSSGGYTMWSCFGLAEDSIAFWMKSRDRRRAATKAQNLGRNGTVKFTIEQTI